MPTINCLTCNDLGSDDNSRQNYKKSIELVMNLLTTKSKGIDTPAALNLLDEAGPGKSSEEQY
jgi:hypothetical protein